MISGIKIIIKKIFFTFNLSKQLSPVEKKKQMDHKYLNKDIDLFYENSNTLLDLQGWRNKLIDVIPTFEEKINFIDFGCGLGDKSYRYLITLNSKYKNAFLVDFSKTSTNIFSKLNFYKFVKIFNVDAILALDKIKPEKLNLVFAFGFIHELEKRKIFLLKLRNNMNDDSLLIISDNNLHYSAEQLDIELNDCGFDNCVYKKIIRIFSVHIFLRVSNNLYCDKFLIIFHKGRSDNILSISNMYYKQFKKLSKYAF